MTVEMKFEPIQAAPGSKVNFGVTVTGADLNNISNEDFDIIKNALYEHTVVVFKGQGELTPYNQYRLTHFFAPDSTTYGHANNNKQVKSVLHPDLKTLPEQPQVQLIGNGFVQSYHGLENITLKHPHHKLFHKTHIPDEEDLDFTRFYRWHIDAALYGKLLPPRVTALMAVKVPKGRTQTLRYDDGSDEEMVVPLGTTAFTSGQTTYDILSDEDKVFARGTLVEYAPHPYIWMRDAKALSTGLGMVSEGKELPLDQLPPWTPEELQILPMCWKNPVTGKLALQIHPAAVAKLHLKDGTVISDLKEVREIVNRLLRPGMSPRYVYAHDWEDGDMVLFNNRGCLHSVVGAFSKDEVRMFRQCNLADNTAPEGPDDM